MARRGATTSGSTSTGISLQDLVEGLKNQQLDMRDDIKKLVVDEEERKREDKKEKSEKRKKESPVSATPSEEIDQSKETKDDQEKKSPEKKEKKKVDPKKKKSVGFARSFLKNFVGKRISEKLTKSFNVENKSTSSSDDGIPRKNTIKGDIHDIKVDIEEIKALLVEKKEQLQGPKKPSVLEKFASFMMKMGARPSSTKGRIWINNGQERRMVRPNEIPPGWKRGMGTKTATKVQNPSPIESKRVTRIPQAEVPAEVSKTEAQVKNEIVPTSLKPAGSADQTQVQDVKTELQRESESKAVQTKLDTILEVLDKIKRKGNSDLLGKFAKFGALLGTVWAAIKGLGKTLALVFKKIVQFGKLLGTWLGRLAKSVGRWVTNAVRSVIPTLRSLLPRAAVGATAAAAAGATYLQFKGLDMILNKAKEEALEPFKKIEEKYGLKSLGMGHFELNGKKYNSYDELPKEYQKLIDAYQFGDKPKSKIAADAQQYIKDHSDEYKALEVKPKQEDKTPIKADVPTNIPAPKTSAVVPAPKMAPAKLMEASVTNADMKRDVTTEPQIVVIKGGNKTTVIPSEKKSQPAILVQARNPEPSLERHNASIFDSPAGYYSLYRM